MKGVLLGCTLVALLFVAFKLGGLKIGSENNFLITSNDSESVSSKEISFDRSSESKGNVMEWRQLVLKEQISQQPRGDQPIYCFGINKRKFRGGVDGGIQEQIFSDFTLVIRKIAEYVVEIKVKVVAKREIWRGEDQRSRIDTPFLFSIDNSLVENPEFSSDKEGQFHMSGSMAVFKEISSGEPTEYAYVVDLSDFIDKSLKFQNISIVAAFCEWPHTSFGVPKGPGLETAHPSNDPAAVFVGKVSRDKILEVKNFTPSVQHSNLASVIFGIQ